MTSRARHVAMAAISLESRGETSPCTPFVRATRTKNKATALFLTLLLGFVPTTRGQVPKPTIDWQFTRLDEIGGHQPTILGTPRLIDSPNGKAVAFDGDSAIFLNANPLAGLAQFTAEVIFQPAATGGKEQRFVHIQEDGSDNRLLFELRLTDDNRWFLDTFIKSGGGNYTLFASNHPHSLGPWYHAAVVMDGKTMKHYINGLEELSTPITFTPQNNGKTSLGVRQNKVSWYTGAIRQLRITPRPLPPADFLKP
jgi:hypothetical protein